jgi:hypothetical protein
MQYASQESTSRRGRRSVESRSRLINHPLHSAPTAICGGGSGWFQRPGVPNHANFSPKMRRHNAGGCENHTPGSDGLFRVWSRDPRRRLPGSWTCSREGDSSVTWQTDSSLSFPRWSEGSPLRARRRPYRDPFSHPNSQAPDVTVPALHRRAFLAGNYRVVLPREFVT